MDEPRQCRGVKGEECHGEALSGIAYCKRCKALMLAAMKREGYLVGPHEVRSFYVTSSTRSQSSFFKSCEDRYETAYGVDEGESYYD